MTPEQAMAYANMQDKIQLQAEYCSRHDMPLFAPKSGYCPYCNTQIYSRISLSDSAYTHITGCPVCHRTYAD